MNKPLVSIALCTYNGEQYLKQQLDSLVAQTYSNVEIVVVDDGSTDQTYTILADYAARFPQFNIYQNERNLGFVSNFERAVKLCKGDLLALCDQDDIWHPDKIALQVDAIKDNMFVYHDSEFIHEDGSPMSKKMSDVVNLYRGDQPEVFLFFNCVSGHTMLIKRELLDAALPLKVGYFHDWWLAYVATNIGAIDFIPECLVQYRQHDKSDTNILRLQRKVDKYKFSSGERFERNKQWLELCLAFPRNKHPEFIAQLYNAFVKRVTSYISFEFASLLYKKRECIFYVQKKSTLSKLNYIYKQIWGAKFKKAGK
ncbi:glycosyltransferase family 2 protein [Inquilinus sp. KBS0705]|nr:glycosyltransferase family 2 protein [Inquilinus sp. KBS0705]